MATKLFCTICYHEHEATSPPEACPRCQADAKSLLAIGVAPSDPASATVALKPQTLEEVRDLARKGLKGVCAVYPHCDGQDDKICQREAYGKSIGSAGSVPGQLPGQCCALAALRLQTRLVGPHFEPDTTLLLRPATCHADHGRLGVGIGRYTEAITEADFCRAPFAAAGRRAP